MFGLLKFSFNVIGWVLWGPFWLAWMVVKAITKSK